MVKNGTKPADIQEKLTKVDNTITPLLAKMTDNETQRSFLRS